MSSGHYSPRVRVTKKLQQTGMEICNRTDMSVEDIVKLTVLKTVDNQWRSRHITLFQHPQHESKVISVGKSYEGELCVICCDDKAAWRRELSSVNNHVITE